MGTDTLIDTLGAIYASPPALQSNFVRDNTRGVARLASLGLITTAIGDSFGNHWRVTYRGLRVLELGENE